VPELLLELFSEEIPARMQARAAEDLARLVGDGLKGAGLAFGEVRRFVSPRRVGVAVADVPASRPDVREERRGPRVGAPEQALQGFLKSAGLASIDQCEKRDVKGVAYYFAVVEKKGGETIQALPAILLVAIKGLPWQKSMRWGESRFAWVRPLHSVLCIFDGKPVSGLVVDPSNLLGVSSLSSVERLSDVGPQAHNIVAGNKTFGHRFLAPDFVEVEDSKTYRERLRRVFVVADPAERRERIRQEARALAAAHDLALKDDDTLLDEVTGLVEWPVPLLGRIDQDSMALPPEVLATSMRAHQKYFALETPERAMAPHFLVVANMVTEDGGAAIVAGNERVLRARLADARFFWEQDRKVKLANRVKALDAITWHAKLGSSSEKVRRIEALAVEIAKRISGADEKRVRRAAELCKADLTTGMVGEFPELQGVMGRYYAIHDNEDRDVANAIAEHWGPVGPSDTCPTAPVSVAVALADKIDSLVGFFGIDEKPTGSKDPYALRRAALGTIRLLVENGLRVSLRAIFFESYRLHLWHTAPLDVNVMNTFFETVNSDVEMVEGILTMNFFQHALNHQGLADKLLDEMRSKDLDEEKIEDLFHEMRMRTGHLERLNFDPEISSANGKPTEQFQALYEREIGFARECASPLIDELLDFFADRLKVVLREKGVRHDLIDAVFALGGEDDLVRLLARVEALRSFIESDDGKNLLVAYRRAANIVKIEAKKDKLERYGVVDPARYTQAEEKALAAALDKVAAESGALIAKEDFAGAMRLLAGLRQPVDAFFDKVTVNAQDRNLRLNRLALLQRLAATMDKIADFSKIEG
jgi:glycyl-tRNA synthetase beta chain